MREYVSKWIRDGHRIFKSSPTGCYFICHAIIKLVGSKYMSPDDHKRANSRLFVSVSQCQKCWMHNTLVSEFSSNEDMYEALCASSQIPFLNSLSLLYTFRNTKCLDGSFTWNWIKLSENTLIISPYKWNTLKNYTYIFNALMATTEEQFYARVFTGYVDAKLNDSDFLSCGLQKRTTAKS